MVKNAGDCVSFITITMGTCLCPPAKKHRGWWWWWWREGRGEARICNTKSHYWTLLQFLKLAVGNLFPKVLHYTLWKLGAVLPVISSARNLHSYPHEVHTIAFHHIVYKFKCIFGAIWLVLCWCALNPSLLPHSPPPPSLKAKITPVNNLLQIYRELPYSHLDSFGDILHTFCLNRRTIGVLSLVRAANPVTVTPRARTSPSVTASVASVDVNMGWRDRNVTSVRRDSTAWCREESAWVRNLILDLSCSVWHF